MAFGGLSRVAAWRALSLFGTAQALVLTGAAPADAAGFYLQEQSTKGWGRANSGEGADQGPSSLWWNPAAIGWDEEASAAFGATAFFPRGQLVDTGTLIDRPGVPPAPVGGASSMPDPVTRGAAPNGAVSLPLGRGLAAGLAVTSPFSFTSDYDPSGWQRYSAIRTRLITIDVQPSIAWAPTDWLSVGAALNAEYADAYLSNALPNLAPGSADGRRILKGDGWDFGWSAGVQLRPAKRVAVGLSYKSSIEHRLDGTIEVRGLSGPLATRNFSADVVARFSTPWQLIMSGRVGVTKGLTLDAQAVRFGWNRFDRIALGAPVNSFLPQGYKNGWSFAFGFDQELGDRLTLRAGIQLDSTPTRDSSRDARVPESDRVDYNVGASYRLSGRMTIDAAAAYTDFQDSPIARDELYYAGTPAETAILTEGRAVEQRALVFSLGGRMRF